jgi:hypothetical protein
LVANLQSHLVALKHIKAQEDAVASGRLMSFALSTGRRRKPATATRAVIGNQPSMHKWFHSIQSSSQSYSGFVQISQVHSTLSTTSYNKKEYNVKGLLSDPHKGVNCTVACIGFVDNVIGNVKVFVCAQCSYTSLQTMWWYNCFFGVLILKP